MSLSCASTATSFLSMGCSRGSSDFTANIPTASTSCRGLWLTTISAASPATSSRSGEMRCGVFGPMTRVPSKRPTASRSTSRCRGWACSPAAGMRGPASTRVSAVSGAKRDTFTRSSASSAGAVCACRGSAGFTVSAGPPALPYPLRMRDRITNYLIGHREVGLDETPVLEHFGAIATEAEIVQAAHEADAVLPLVGAPALVRPLPLISCLCPTFGRCGSPWQHLLEESVESFLRQTDVHSELVILNDHPGQELAFDHPRVRVVNQPVRFRTLGEKYNAMVALAGGSLLAPWEDDDISLPHRLELSRERLGDRDYYNPRQHWCVDDRGLHWDTAMGVGHNLSLFRRRAWQTVGGYPVVTGSQDMEMDRLLSAHPQVCCRVDDEPLPVPDWYYLYRWGVSPCHLSAVPDMQGLYDSLGGAPTAAGRFKLSPHWRQDYSALAASGARQWRTASGPGDREDAAGQPSRARRARL